MDCFKLFISDGIIQKIIRYTNEHGRDDPKEKDWKELTEKEVWAFFGLLMIAGVQKQRKTPIKTLWTTEYFLRQAFFPTVMSRSRFQAIMRHLRFDCRTDRSLLLKNNDQLAAIRLVYDEFVSNCIKSYNPSQIITIDERLVPFKGGCKFGVYMKNKPGRHGLKVWVAADSENAYACNLQVYFPGNRCSYFCNIY